MEINEIRGTWKSKNMPIHNFPDQLKFTLYISNSDIITLWYTDEKQNSITLSEGKVIIENKIDDNFSINISGSALDNKFLNLNGRMQIKAKPSAFLISIPDFGERYFEKLN